MKKAIFSLFAALVLTVSAFASDNVNNRLILQNFYTDFSNAQHVSWVVKNEFTKATFEMDGQKMEAFYNDNGDLIASSATVSANNLPKQLVQKIADKLKGYTMKEAIMLTAGQETNYYISLSDGTRTFIVKSNLEGSSFEVSRK